MTIILLPCTWQYMCLLIDISILVTKDIFLPLRLYNILSFSIDLLVLLCLLALLLEMMKPEMRTYMIISCGVL
uniref:Uncharacterized protein n=1 Tax=Aegilops tauschii subsp. strangulata TaxID=200361 RepID=A0A453QYI9_AEGTS